MTYDHVLGFAQSIGENFAPMMLVRLVDFVSAQRFAACDIFEAEILGDHRSATVGVEHAGRLVELADSPFHRVPRSVLTLQRLSDVISPGNSWRWARLGRN